MIQQVTIGMGIAVGAIALRLAGALHSTNAGSLTAGDFRIAFALVGVIALVAVIDFQSRFKCRRRGERPSSYGWSYS
jgi:hypothetical protein